MSPPQFEWCWVHYDLLLDCSIILSSLYKIMCMSVTINWFISLPYLLVLKDLNASPVCGLKVCRFRVFVWT